MAQEWKSTVRILFVVHLLTGAGFNLVLPFLPLYVKELGAGSGSSVELWSGIIFSLPALAMMISAPIWGYIADRRGRKLMLIRSTMAGAVVLALMGFVQSVEQLAVLRGFQGLLTGNIAASNALVAATIPKRHVGESFGFLRTATWVGAGLGPLLGGVIGDTLGFRASFWITGGLLLLSGFLVIYMIKEQFQPRDLNIGRGILGVYGIILRAPGMLRLFSLSFLHNLARSLIFPVIPFYLIILMGTQDGVSTVTGVMMGVKAFLAAIAAIYVGRLGDRLGHGRVVVSATVLLVVLYLPQLFVNASWQLVLLQVLTGLAAVGVVPGLSALFTLYLPEGTHGATFGMEGSIDALARTIGPMLGAGIMAWWGPGWAFGAVALVYLAGTLLALPLYRKVSAD